MHICITRFSKLNCNFDDLGRSSCFILMFKTSFVLKLSLDHFWPLKTTLTIQWPLNHPNDVFLWISRLRAFERRIWPCCPTTRYNFSVFDPNTLMPLTFFAGGCRQRLFPIMKHHNRLVHPCKYQLGSAWFALSRADLPKFWPKKTQKRAKGKIFHFSEWTGSTY